MKSQTLISCLTLTLILSANAADTQAVGKLNGIATDSEGAIIANATVIIHRDWPDDHTRDLNLITNGGGTFSIDLTPGFYDVAVFAHAFSPYAGKVRIRSSQVTNYVAKLSADPQMMAEFGDTFFDYPPSAKPPSKPKR
jgi:hypothetical protein